MYKWKVRCFTPENVEFTLTIHADSESEAKHKAEKMSDPRCVHSVKRVG